MALGGRQIRHIGLTVRAGGTPARVLISSKGKLEGPVLKASRYFCSFRYWLSRPESGAEPDDWKRDDPLGEDCGHIDTTEETEMSWMDASCKKLYGWICEKSV